MRASAVALKVGEVANPRFPSVSRMVSVAARNRSAKRNFDTGPPAHASAFG